MKTSDFMVELLNLPTEKYVYVKRHGKLLSINGIAIDEDKVILKNRCNAERTVYEVMTMLQMCMFCKDRDVYFDSEPLESREVKVC